MRDAGVGGDGAHGHEQRDDAAKISSRHHPLTRLDRADGLRLLDLQLESHADSGAERPKSADRAAWEAKPPEGEPEAMRVCSVLAIHPPADGGSGAGGVVAAHEAALPES